MAISQRFLVFLVFLATTHCCAVAIEEDNLATHPINLSTTVYDLLPQYGFPKGLLPDAVKSYTLSTNGDFQIELYRQCYVHFDKLVFYDKKITGKLKYGSITDVSGIQAKKLFVWVSVTGIEAEPGSNFIDFYVGFLSEKLPREQFQEIPSCKNKACKEGKDHEEEELAMVSEV